MRKMILLVAGVMVFSLAGISSAQVPQASRAGRGVQRPEYQWSPLHWAVRYNDGTEARELATGRNVDARDALGRTPLHIATMFGLQDMVALLLERGADVNARDQWGVTPLYRLELVRRFRGWEHSEIAAMLRAAGGVKMDMRGLREREK